MRALLVLVLVGCALVGANLVGLSYTDYASNAIVSLSPANASVISQSLGFNSQWLYALSSTIDLTSGTYYLYTMNATGAYQYAVPLASLSSYTTVALSQPQIYCAEFEPVSGSVFALSQNDSLIVQLVRVNPVTGDVTILFSFPDGWMVPYFTSALVNSAYVAVLNSPTGQVMIVYNTSTGGILQFSLGASGVVALATDGTPTSVLALRLQGLSASLTRQSLISPAYTTVATLPSSVTTFQYATAVAAGIFYIVVRPPTSLSPLLLSLDLTTGAIATQPLAANTYLAFMQSSTL